MGANRPREITGELTKMRRIGLRIRESRIARDMSQEEVGRVLGVQGAAISKKERGDDDSLTVMQLIQLAELFERKLGFFLQDIK